MMRVSTASYTTRVDIETRIRQLDADALRLWANANEHREIIKQIAQLRLSANANRQDDRPIKASCTIGTTGP